MSEEEDFKAFLKSKGVPQDQIDSYQYTPEAKRNAEAVDTFAKQSEAGFKKFQHDQQNTTIDVLGNQFEVPSFLTGPVGGLAAGGLGVLAAQKLGPGIVKSLKDRMTPQPPIERVEPTFTPQTPADVAAVQAGEPMPVEQVQNKLTLEQAKQRLSQLRGEAPPVAQPVPPTYNVPTGVPESPIQQLIPTTPAPQFAPPTNENQFVGPMKPEVPPETPVVEPKTSQVAKAVKPPKEFIGPMPELVGPPSVPEGRILSAKNPNKTNKVLPSDVIGQGGWHWYQGQMGPEAEANWLRQFGRTNVSYNDVKQAVKEGRLPGAELTDGKKGGTFPRQSTVPEYIKGQASLGMLSNLAGGALTAAQVPEAMKTGDWSNVGLGALGQIAANIGSRSGLGAALMQPSSVESGKLTPEIIKLQNELAKLSPAEQKAYFERINKRKAIAPPH